ncbi:hypothetical protein BH11PSE11_BH11PSE11_08010 [soil metagenome]
MMLQIILHTPIWVWALLVTLITFGILASVDRATSLRKASIISVSMLALSLQGVVTAFGGGGAALPSWFGFLLAGSMLGWILFDAKSIVADSRRGVLLQEGSWIPLILMMGIFFTKYCANVMLAFHAEYRQDWVFIAVVCGLYGLFSGVFAGKLLRTVTVHRNALALMPISAKPALVK